MKSKDFYRILIEKNPYPTKEIIKLYGELSLLEGMLEVAPENKQAQINHATTLMLCQAEVFVAATCGYTKPSNLKISNFHNYTSWTTIEVNPCRNVNDEVEVCEPKEAEFWSVYVRKTDGLASCIADLPTKSMANQLKETILNLAKHFQGEAV